MQYLIAILVDFPWQSLVEIALLILRLQSEFTDDQKKFVSLDGHLVLFMSSSSTTVATFASVPSR